MSTQTNLMLNEYSTPATTTNLSASANTWSAQPGPSANTGTTGTTGVPSSFNNYTLNKWPNSSSQNSTPTANNNAGLAAAPATFPFGGIPPLYPSVSAQSSNSVDIANATYPFPMPQMPMAQMPSVPKSSSASSLPALNAGIGKMSINAAGTPSAAAAAAAAASGATTPYNPYNGGFTPYGATTPTGHSAANTPNAASTTQFRFGGYPTVYTPAMPPLGMGMVPNPIGAVGMNGLTPNAMNAVGAMQQMAAGYPLNTALPNALQQPNQPIGGPTPSATNALSPTALTPPKFNKKKLNRNAVAFEPTVAPPNDDVSGPVGVGGPDMANEHYPSYAQAVNKDAAGNVVEVTDGVGAVGTSKPENVTADNVGAEDAKGADIAAKGISAESSSAIQKLNPLTWPSSPRMAKFYVIKSFGEDDVHKSIKYNLWCSTERGNRKLDEAFAESKRACERAGLGPNGTPIDSRDTQHGCPVYLFFSVNRSGCFCGMAQMISSYYAERHFGSWVQDGKWQGSFIVKWIYVKDIPNKDLKDITLANNDGRPVTFSRDTQEIPFAQGVTMLRRFIEYKPKTNILQDFQYYDDRERDIKHKRTQLLENGGQQGQGRGAMGGMQNGPMGRGGGRGGGYGRGRGYQRGGGGYGRDRHNGGYRDRGRPSMNGRGRGRGRRGGRGGPYMNGDRDKEGRNERYGNFQILKRGQNGGQQGQGQQQNNGYGRGDYGGRGGGVQRVPSQPRGGGQGMVQVGGGQVNGGQMASAKGNNGQEENGGRVEGRMTQSRNRWVPK